MRLPPLSRCSCGRTPKTKTSRPSRDPVYTAACAWCGAETYPEADAAAAICAWNAGELAQTVSPERRAAQPIVRHTIPK